MGAAKRLEWLDAMRGFTMILVVSYHVALFGFGQSEKISCSLPFLVLFRMPLFFFVSGFLAYKSKYSWSGHNMLSMTWKKIKIQVIPALVFLSAYLIFCKSGDFGTLFVDSLSSPTKSGYWFTFVLLQMFLIYYFVSWVSERLRLNADVVILLLWFVCVFAYATLYMPLWFSYFKAPWFKAASLFMTFKFFHFFLLGNIVHRYWNEVQKLFDSKYFFPSVVAIAFVCTSDFLVWHSTKGMWTNLPRTVSMYSLMLMVIIFFRHYGECFTQERALGRFFQYIGTRTLDIYLLHFMFLPHLPMVGKFLNEHHPNFCLDIVCAVSVALVIIAFCCLTSNILRISPLFRTYLFGRK